MTTRRAFLAAAGAAAVAIPAAVRLEPPTSDKEHMAKLAVRRMVIEEISRWERRLAVIQQQLHAVRDGEVSVSDEYLKRLTEQRHDAARMVGIYGG